MAGSSFGKIFTITTWGESHGVALGVTIDGCPAGIEINEEIIQAELDKRKPSSGAASTNRKEADKAQILSGVFEGKTTGTPITIVVFNQDHHSADYSNIANVFRPGHADFGFDSKYGFRDYRGGGRSSGRETLARVAAGAIAKQFLAQLGINITAYTAAIGPVSIKSVDTSVIWNNTYRLADMSVYDEVDAFVNQLRMSCDSAGGIIECRITGMPAGVGDPVFDKLDSRLAYAIMSIGAVKGVEIGDGFNAALLKGSENNDPFIVKDGKVTTSSNHAGGILGGMSNGNDIILRAAIKPTPSISQKQSTVNRASEETEIEIKGRHDVVIVPRAVPVVESLCAITLVDALLSNMGARMDKIKDFYN